MSFQSFVTQQLAAINQILNAISINAKKIDELPVQNTLDVNSKIQASRAGTSESVTIAQIIAASTNSGGDCLLFVGEIVVDGNVVKIPAGASWIIDGVNYATSALTEITVPYSASGLIRLDLLVANTLNQIVLEMGSETAGIVVPPNKPVNTVLVSQILVSDSEVGDPDPPIIGDGYVLKMESQDFIANYGPTTVIEQIDLIDERSSILLTGAITDVKSIQISGEFMRPGKPFFIKNGTGHNVKLWQLAGTGNVKISFSDEEDLLFRDKEIIEFKLNVNDSSDIKIEYVGAAGKEDESNKQNSLDIDGTGKKYATVDAVNAGRGVFPGYKILTDFSDVAYGKLSKATSVGVNTAIPIVQKVTTAYSKIQFYDSTSFRLLQGRKYRISANIQANFNAVTSYGIFCFWDRTNNVWIDNTYPDGKGSSSLNVPHAFAGNNNSLPLVQAMVIPTKNIIVEVRLKQVNGNCDTVDAANAYSSVAIEEFGLTEQKVLTTIPDLYPNGHIQGVAYDGTPTAQYFYAGWTDRVTKMDFATGSIVASRTFADHMGGVAYHNGSVYACFTPLADFNGPNTTSKIYELSPVDLSIIRQHTLTTANYGLGCIASDGTDLFIGFGHHPTPVTGNIRKVNITTLELTGPLITIPNVSNEFGGGIQQMSFYNNKWYIGTHLLGVLADPSGYNGGGMVITDSTFTTVHNRIKKETGDWATGYGNGFMIYKGFPYWVEVLRISSPYTHQIRLYEDPLI